MSTHFIIQLVDVRPSPVRPIFAVRVRTGENQCLTLVSRNLEIVGQIVSE